MRKNMVNMGMIFPDPDPTLPKCSGSDLIRMKNTERTYKKRNEKMSNYCKARERN
jgi:hypothetical protein